MNIIPIPIPIFWKIPIYRYRYRLYRLSVHPYFLDHALISLNTAPTPKLMFLVVIEKHILIIWNMYYKSSSYSPSVQLLHQQIRGGASKLALIMLTQGGEVQNQGKLADVILEHSLTSQAGRKIYGPPTAMDLKRNGLERSWKVLEGLNRSSKVLKGLKSPEISWSLYCFFKVIKFVKDI